MLVWIARNVVWEVFVVILRVQLPPLPITIRCKLTEQKDWLKLYLTGSKIQSRERISGFKTSWKRGERQTFIYISGQFVRRMSKNGNHTHRSFIAGNTLNVLVQTFCEMNLILWKGCNEFKHRLNLRIVYIRIDDKRWRAQVVITCIRYRRRQFKFNFLMKVSRLKIRFLFLLIQQ